MPRKLSQEQFITKSKKIHDNKYDYSLSIYVSSQKKVKIICKIHGLFEQTPNNHIYGKYGCWKCRKTRTGPSFANFVSRAVHLHNGKYTYEVTSFKNVSSTVTIICPSHGSFQQRGSDHLQGKGCRTCMGEQARIRYISNKDEFIRKSGDIFKNRYDYNQVVYTGSKDHVVITCKKHGDFSMSPNNHLRGHGCPICANTPVSAISQKWLNLLGVPQEYREKKLNVGEQMITVDAYDPDTNTVFEFWHGNPKVFNQTEINYRSKKPFGELYENTIVRRSAIIEAGYNLVEIWENDFRMEGKNA